MISFLQVVAPPTEEPVSVDLARLHLRVDQTGDDALIAAYITAARSWAETYLGRALVNQQLLWTMARDQVSNGSPYLSMPLSLLVLPMWMQWPLLGQQAIELPRKPVISVDSVAYGQWGQTDTTLTAGTDYDVDPTTARLRIHPGSEVLPNDHIAITFTTGYAAGTIPQPISIAILMLTAFLYENRGDSGGEMPMAAEMLLTPYRLVTFG